MGVGTKRTVDLSLLSRSLIQNRKEVTKMHNNKNRIKDREKTNPELRKMEPRDNSDEGMINGKVIGVHESKHEKTRRKV